VKYETPAGSKVRIDVHPLARQWVENADRPLFVTEGVRKADSAVSRGLCCIGLLSVSTWREAALPDWDHIALKGRAIYIVFDSDVMEKVEVHRQLQGLARFLSDRGGAVRYIYLPHRHGGAKVGLDDYFAAGHSAEQLLSHATIELRLPALVDEQGRPAGPYRETPAGITWLKPTRDDLVSVPLTNFIARIVVDVTEDDGSGELRREFEIEASMAGRNYRFGVPHAAFAGMNWPLEHLGAGALVYPGMGLRDHARAAIQLLSDGVAERRVLSHTGWRQLEDGQWVYLHAGGAIGRAGALAEVETRLGSLATYQLPAPPAGRDLVDCIRVVLALLDVAPAPIAYTLLILAFCAVLGDADFSVHLAGPTGAGKTVLAALVQQLFGAGMDARHLPGSWSSTANALEGLAFQVKDALLVVDDFAPGGTTNDVQRLHREADRLLRAQGNASARQRMRADTSLRPARPPRGLILSTGEDIPRGQSLRARLLTLELAPGELDWQRVTAAQGDAARGAYAAAMAGFVQWMADRHDEVREQYRKRQRELRERAYRSGAHRRTPDIIASLAATWALFLEFARDADAISEERAAELWASGWAALEEVGARQAQHQASAEPTEHFLRLLRAAIASGSCHVAGTRGESPPGPAPWGWRMVAVGSCRNEWRPLGKRAGWLDGEHLYLEPEASFAAAQEMGRATGDPLAIAAVTLRKRLKERGLLADVDRARGTLTARRTVEGARRDVLVLPVSLVSGKPDQTDQPDHGGASERAAESGYNPSWSGFVVGFRAAGAETRPGNPTIEAAVTGQSESGHLGARTRNPGNGRVGRVLSAGESPACRSDRAELAPAPARFVCPCGSVTFDKDAGGRRYCAQCFGLEGGERTAAGGEGDAGEPEVTV
jgi:hypothetical protein